MSTGALPHLLQRLRRRYTLAMLRTRQRQLAECIDGLEMQIYQEETDLQAMVAEHARISAQIAQAEQPLPAFARTGWGQS